MAVLGLQDHERFLHKLDEASLLDLCADILAIEGHTNIRITDGPGDGQRDIHSIDSDGKKCLTQSKYHRDLNQSVSAKELGEVVLGMVRLGYDKGLFITSAKISPQAKRDCLNDYPNYSVDYLEGWEIVRKVFENLTLKAIWYDGQSLEKISYTIIVPLLARDLETDKPLPLLPRHEDMLDGSKFTAGRSEIQIRLQRSKTSTQVFGEYRSPKVKTFSELGSSQVSVTEAILSGVLYLEDINDILSILGKEIVDHVKILNPDKMHFAVLLGKPSLTPLGGESSGARIELQDIEPKTLVCHQGSTSSEIDWILPSKDLGWVLPQRPSVSQAEWIRWYNSANDICLDILIHCPPSDQIKWQFVEQRNFVMKWWKESLFIVVPSNLVNNWKEKNIAEPTKSYTWDKDTSLCIWLHPTLNSPIVEFPIESEHEPWKPSFSEDNLNEVRHDLQEIRSSVERVGGTLVDPEKARHMVAIRDHDPYPDVEIAEFQARHLAYDVYTVPTPIDPASRRFQFSVCWVVKTKTESKALTNFELDELISKLKEKSYPSFEVEFFSDSQTQSKESFVIAEIEVFSENSQDSTAQVLAKIENLVLGVVIEIEEISRQYAEVIRATRIYWDKEILMLF